MRTVRDESGTHYILLKQSGQSSLVRDPETVTLSQFAHGLGLTPDPADLPVGGRPWRARLKGALEGVDGEGLGCTLKDLFQGNP